MIDNDNKYTLKPGSIEIKYQKIKKISPSSDGNFLLIYREGHLSRCYLRKITLNKNKEKDKEQNEIVSYNLDFDDIEIYPSAETKAILACALKNKIILLPLKKNLDFNDQIREYKINQNLHVKKLTCQDIKDGLLAALLSNNSIFIFEKNHKDPIFVFYNKLQIFSMSFITTNKIEWFISGQVNKIKVFDLINPNNNEQLNKDNIPFKENTEEECSVDVISKNKNGSLLLIGSKMNAPIQIFEIKDYCEELKLSNTLKIPKSDSKEQLINAVFIEKNGIAVATNNRLYLYYIKKDNIILDQTVDSEMPVSIFLFIVYSYQYYFVYSQEDRMLLNEFTYDGDCLNDDEVNNSLNQNDNKINDNAKLKKISETNKSKKINNQIDIVNLKNYDKNYYVKKIKKIENISVFNITKKKKLNIQIKDVVIELGFKFNSLSLLLIKYSNNQPDIKKIKELIDFFNKNPQNEDLISILEKIKNIIIQKKKSYSRDMQECIIPYVQTCTFVYNPKGKVYAYRYNKYNFKSFKQKYKNISTYTSLTNLINYSTNEHPNIEIISSNGRLLDDDNENNNNEIVSESLISLTNFNFSFNNEIKLYLNYINSEQSLPQVITYTDVEGKEYKNLEYSGRKSVDNKNLPNNEESKNLQLNNSSIKYVASAENLAIESHQQNNEKNEQRRNSDFKTSVQETKEFEFEIIKKINWKILTNENFYNYVLSCLKDNPNEEESILRDILSQIKFSIDRILKEKNTLLLDLYKKNILIILQTLEIKKRFEFLFIIIIIMSTIIFSDTIARYPFMKRKKERKLSENFSNGFSIDESKNLATNLNNTFHMKINCKKFLFSKSNFGSANDIVCLRRIISYDALSKINSEKDLSQKCHMKEPENIDNLSNNTQGNINPIESFDSQKDLPSQESFTLNQQDYKKVDDLIDNNELYDNYEGLSMDEKSDPFENDELSPFSKHGKNSFNRKNFEDRSITSEDEIKNKNKKCTDTNLTKVIKIKEDEEHSNSNDIKKMDVLLKGYNVQGMNLNMNENVGISNSMRKIKTGSKELIWYSPTDNLVRVFGEQFIENLLQYVVFFSYELYKMNKKNESKEVHEFSVLARKTMRNICLNRK